MSHRRFRGCLAFDVVVGAFAVASLISVSAFAPAWVVGAVCLLVIPTLILGVLVAAVVQSRRRDPDESSPAAPIQGGPVASPSASPLTHWRAPGLPSGSARPNPPEPER